jgi:hypothetical protein
VPDTAHNNFTILWKSYKLFSQRATDVTDWLILTFFPTWIHFFFVVLGFERRLYTLSHSTSPILWWVFFQDRVSWTIYPKVRSSWSLPPEYLRLQAWATSTRLELILIHSCLALPNLMGLILCKTAHFILISSEAIHDPFSLSQESILGLVSARLLAQR